MTDPEIIQGGMGVGVSDWRLARAVSRLGQLGVVSGTALDVQLARRLQLGDPGGDLRRAMESFPDAEIATRVRERYFVEEGIEMDRPFPRIPRYTVDPPRELWELTVLANFVEVYLAREAHEGPVGINYLEKVQLPVLPSLYGALLAGVDYVLIGAGIPLDVPGVLTRLVEHRPASVRAHLTENGNGGKEVRLRFDPSWVDAGTPSLSRPSFLPIVSSVALAKILLKRADGPVDGFVVEGPEAGGHNAPPRGKTRLDGNGEPIYGPRDRPDLGELRSLEVPFWLAGSQGHPGCLERAQDRGAAGIQVGTAFAFCRESGLDPGFRRIVIDAILSGDDAVRTDPLASPTGFPFKVLEVPGTLSDEAVYSSRRRRCDLGYLREVYRREEGSIGYRCPAEPVHAYVHKKGREEETVGRKCLCNALLANVGLAQRGPDSWIEPPLLTAGRDLSCLGYYLTAGERDYGARDVVKTLATGSPPRSSTWNPDEERTGAGVGDSGPVIPGE
ncbi:MAG: nitronate monooxygenase [Thermoanaerobaculia bacterium]|nr:nitronate monooxygenase [Thermoanaerobaculia bacterium]